MPETDTAEMFVNMLLATGVLIGSVAAIVVISVIVYRRTQTTEYGDGEALSRRSDEV
jgi:heme/copper-type cytochrome/quinol oxidase subunit 2